jgi:hypothetical protein
MCPLQDRAAYSGARDPVPIGYETTWPPKKVRMDAVEKKEIASRYRDRNFDSSAAQSNHASHDIVKRCTSVLIYTECPRRKGQYSDRS